MEAEQSQDPPESLQQVTETSSEIQEYIEVSQRQHSLFPRAALVGLCAGIMAIIFRALLLGAEILRNSIIGWSYQLSYFGWVVPVLFSAVGAYAAVKVVTHFAPEASGSGIPHLKAVLHRLRDLAWLRILLTKIVGGVLAIGSGMALGREGPTVQMGGAVGEAIGRWLNTSTRDRLTLIAAGAGAGLAAAFNAPLSGLIFVLEEVQRDFRPAVFGAAFLAAAIADVVARLASGQLPVIAVPDYPTPPLDALPAFMVLGCIAGVLGVAFNRSLLWTLSWMADYRRKSVLAVAAPIGAICGLIAWLSPITVGGGHGLIEHVLAGDITMMALAVAFVLRFALVLGSYGTGAAGGIFLPLLVIGAMIGLAVGRTANVIMPAMVAEPAVFAVVGMAAYFTAIVRAPLTGVILIIEMTGNYEQMLPLLVSCFCAYAVAEYLRDVPIYEALLDRDMSRRGIASERREPVIAEFEVEQDAVFAGKLVRELGLPAGCVLVRCVMDGHEYVPAGDTKLREHARITAVITPEAMNALKLLRRGCESRH